MQISSLYSALFLWSSIFFVIKPSTYVSTIRLVLKEEASDYLELETIKNLVRKYSQFINFPIYVWASKVMIERWFLPHSDSHWNPAQVGL